jgi:hypothetical protein
MMSELFYFSFADLMVRAEYNPEANSLRYFSHRKITFNERLLVEQYLLTNHAQKTDYYKKEPSFFIYLGKEPQLVKELNLFHLKSSLQTLVEKEKDVKESVHDLIHQSMQNYYFEQIGEALLAMRQEATVGVSRERALPLRRKLEELVEAYNIYAGQKLSITEVIPADLQPHFGFPVIASSRARKVEDHKMD